MKFPTDYLGHANTLPKKDERRKHYKKQYKTRGWDDTELWSLDSTILKFLQIRLDAFKENLHGYPSSMTMEQWQATLSQMADDAKYLSEKQYDLDRDKESAEYREVFNRFFDSLKTHFFDLWD